MADFKIDPKRTALIVQDLQNDVIIEKGAFADSGSPEHAKEQNVVENAKRLIEACRTKTRRVLLAGRPRRSRLHAHRILLAPPSRPWMTQSESVANPVRAHGRGQPGSHARRVSSSKRAALTRSAAS